MKIVLINHAFQKEFFRARWVKFANAHKDIELYLIAPEEYAWGNSKTLTYGTTEVITAKSFADDNFHFITVQHSDCITKGWKSSEFKKILLSIKPDIIYHIGSHTQNPLFQIINIKRHYLKQTILIAFSMRGPNTNKHSRIMLIKHDKNLIRNILRIPMYFLDLIHLAKFNKFVDCVVCHYPGAKDMFVKEGFNKRISVQTQVGVNTSMFYPSCDHRNEIRKQYNLNDSFVFGSASRFNYSKGILQILDALKNVKGNWKYLLIGSGLPEEINTIKQKIIDNGLEQNVIMTGYINTSEMPKYWNAIDCAIHFPLSTPKWIETFSLALVQAMATKDAVIGSSSGSVPYQVGENGVIVNEGDSVSLSVQMQKMIDDRDHFIKNSEIMYERATKMFSIDSLNEQFYNLLCEISDMKENEGKI